MCCSFFLYPVRSDQRRREFLTIEHTHALSVSTTRAASVVVSCAVVRDLFYDGNVKQEQTVVAMRITQSFLRFRSFEIFKDTFYSTRSARRGPSARPEARVEMMRHKLVVAIRQNLPAVLDAKVDEAERTYVMRVEE